VRFLLVTSPSANARRIVKLSRQSDAVATTLNASSCAREWMSNATSDAPTPRRIWPAAAGKASPNSRRTPRFSVLKNFRAFDPPASHL